MDVSSTHRHHGALGLCSALGLWLGCMPGAGPGVQRATPAPSQPEPAVEAELRAAPPSAGSSSAGNSSIRGPISAAASAAGAGGGASAPVPHQAPFDDAMACLQPADPELDQESPWSRDLGQRLERVLPSLRRCTLDLDSADEASITLRLVYGKDGSPISQHVVTSSSNACAVSECLKQALAGVRSSKLLIDKASIDLALALTRNGVPVRQDQPIDPLTPDEALASAGGCVDADVARLSQTAVRSIVSTSYDELQSCYGQALTRNHAATGKVTFEFVIGQNGSVAEAWARDATLPDCAAIECMLAQFRALRFPEPVGRSVRVIYPISYVLEQQPVQLR